MGNERKENVICRVFQRSGIRTLDHVQKYLFSTAPFNIPGKEKNVKRFELSYSFFNETGIEPAPLHLAADALPKYRFTTSLAIIFKTGNKL
jgi:hypothetical protein